MILNDDSGSELCTDKDYGFEGDDGVDLITWTLPAESVTKGTGIFSNRLKYNRGFSHTLPGDKYQIQSHTRFSEPRLSRTNNRFQDLLQRLLRVHSDKRCHHRLD